MPDCEDVESRIPVHDVDPVLADDDLAGTGEPAVDRDLDGSFRNGDVDDLEPEEGVGDEHVVSGEADVSEAVIDAERGFLPGVGRAGGVDGPPETAVVIT